MKLAILRTGVRIAATVACWVLMAGSVMAALRIDSVYPTLGKLGVDLGVTIAGDGFDQHTRVSMDLDTGNTISILASVDTEGVSEAVAISGTLAYVASGPEGLQTIDISDPTNPTLVGIVDTPGRAGDVAISGSTAFVADGDSGLQLIDISNPTLSNLIGSIDTEGAAQDLAIADNTAYVVDGLSLNIIDLSDVSSPMMIGSVSTPGGNHGVTINGNTAYVADDYYGIQIIDVSTPSIPTIIQTVDTPGYAKNIAISGNIAIVASYEAGLAIMPLPAKAVSSTITSATSISCALPGPSLAGNYNLLVFNTTENDELTGAVTFLESVGFEPKSEIKAIIVAGCGDYAGNTLWPSTLLVANQAFKTLVSQGYTKENIHYLRPHNVDLFPDDFPYGSVDNPEVFVKIYIAASGWCNMAFNHVTVDAVEILSASSLQRPGRPVRHGHTQRPTGRTPVYGSRYAIGLNRSLLN